MKAIVTLIFVLFIGMTVQAQEAKTEVKVATLTMGIVTNGCLETTIKCEGEVARLYLFKNSRVKKELSFTTKSNRSKLA